MTKRPPEIRNKNPDIKPSIEIPKKENKCELCGNPYEIVAGATRLCLECFDDFCECCHSKKPFITVRRDPKNQEHKTIQQLCSDCYSRLCNDIVKLDASYGIDSVDSKKADKYGI